MGLEVCDAVEEETFNIDGIAMSDFVFPAYFDIFRLKRPGSAHIDYPEKSNGPFRYSRAAIPTSATTEGPSRNDGSMAISQASLWRTAVGTVVNSAKGAERNGNHHSVAMILAVLLYTASRPAPRRTEA